MSPLNQVLSRYLKAFKKTHIIVMNILKPPSDLYHHFSELLCRLLLLLQKGDQSALAADFHQNHQRLLEGGHGVKPEREIHYSMLIQNPYLTTLGWLKRLISRTSAIVSRMIFFVALPIATLMATGISTGLRLLDGSFFDPSYRLREEQERASVSGKARVISAGRMPQYSSFGNSRNSYIRIFLFVSESSRCLIRCIYRLWPFQL